MRQTGFRSDLIGIRSRGPGLSSMVGVVSVAHRPAVAGAAAAEDDGVAVAAEAAAGPAQAGADLVAVGDVVVAQAERIVLAGLLRIDCRRLRLRGRRECEAE